MLRGIRKIWDVISGKRLKIAEEANRVAHDELRMCIQAGRKNVGYLIRDMNKIDEMFSQREKNVQQ